MTYVHVSDTEYVARFFHRCDLCEQLITPLERYVRTVKIYKHEGSVCVEIYRRHDPFCPYDPDELLEELAMSENAYALPLAA